jgi:hypothetical protein
MDDDAVPLSFQLLTTLVYRPSGYDLGPAWSALTSDPSETAPLLRSRHIPRLRRAHDALRKSAPGSWCSRVDVAADDDIVAEFRQACEAAGLDKAQRVRRMGPASGEIT